MLWASLTSAYSLLGPDRCVCMHVKQWAQSDKNRTDNQYSSQQRRYEPGGGGRNFITTRSMVAHRYNTDQHLQMTEAWPVVSNTALDLPNCWCHRRQGQLQPLGSTLGPDCGSAPGQPCPRCQTSCSVAPHLSSASERPLQGKIILSPVFVVSCCFY